MSAYLNIYIQPNEREDKILILSTSRNSEIYNYFQEYAPFCFNETKYKELTVEIIDNIRDILNKDINKQQKKVINYLSLKQSSETDETIMSLKEYIHDLEYILAQIDFLACMYFNASLHNSKLFINIT